MGPVPLPGHPLGLRPAHVRLRVQAVDRRARRSPTAARSSTTSARPPPRTGSTRHIRFGHRVVRAEWSTADARWTVDVRAHRHRGDAERSPRAGCSAPAATTATTRATRPRFEGRERFGGQIVHPQHWPEDLDYTGKRVVVIGSGATAVTIVPAMADARRARDDAAALAVLRPARCPPRTRSPTACAACSATDRALRPHPPQEHLCCRRRSTRSAAASRADAPRSSARVNGAQLPDGLSPSTPTSSPRYDPWDQRLCVVPDGDLFQAIRQRPRLDRHRPHRHVHRDRASGSPPARELEADIVVTATGLNLLAFGGIELVVDGATVVAARHGRLQGR